MHNYDFQRRHVSEHLIRLSNKKVLIVTLLDIISGYQDDAQSTDFIVNLDYILQHASKYDAIIIDYATTYLRDSIEAELYYQLLTHKISTPWVIITSNVDYYKKDHPGIIYYPIHLIDGLDKSIDIEINIKDLRPHNICFLTFHYHWHRLIILTELYKKFKFDKCLINLPLYADLNPSQKQSLENAKFYIESQEIISEMWEMAPIIADTTDKQDEIVDVGNNAFRDSYVNVFSESDYPNIFPTEKCIKPFLSGQFYAVFAHPKVYAHLVELGFDLLDDYYTVTDGTTFNEQLESLLNTIDANRATIDTQWEETYSRRLNNYTLVRSPKLRTKLTKDLQHWLNTQGASHNDI